MPEVQVGDVTLHAEVEGDGEPLVLICGTGMDSGGWVLHRGWLAAERRVVLFDNRDSGRSSYVDHDYTPADMARDTAGVIRGLGLERVDVLGYSLGGAVAQELALASPELVRSLVLLSTWAGPDPWLGHRFRCWERLAATLEREDLADFGVIDLFTEAWFEDPARLEVYRAVSLANPHPQRREGLVRQWRADQAHDARARVGGISCPALVIGASQDRLVPARFSEELADLVPGARLETLPGLGHGGFIEDADRFRRIVSGFWESL